MRRGEKEKINSFFLFSLKSFKRRRPSHCFASSTWKCFYRNHVISISPHSIPLECRNGYSHLRLKSLHLIAIDCLGVSLLCVAQRKRRRRRRRKNGFLLFSSSFLFFLSICHRCCCCCCCGRRQWRYSN